MSAAEAASKCEIRILHFELRSEELFVAKDVTADREKDEVADTIVEFFRFGDDAIDHRAVRESHLPARRESQEFCDKSFCQRFAIFRNQVAVFAKTFEGLTVLQDSGIINGGTNFVTNVCVPSASDGWSFPFS